MKKYMLKKKIFAAVFLVVVFGFSLLNMIHTWEPLKNLYRTAEELTPQGIETCMEENLYGRMTFIETFGLVQTLMDKREYNNFAMIKDEEGYLQYASFYREADTEIFRYALRVKRLKDYADTRGTKVLFVVAPSKYSTGYTTLRTGMPVNDPENTVTELLFHLNRLGIETLNLGEVMPNKNISYEETFFKSDHHWTVPAAFYATGVLADKLKESFGVELDTEHYYTDMKSYEERTYLGGMLGSMGRKTGAVFSGVDNFTALFPRFEGSFYRESMSNSEREEVREGSFEEAFMDEKVLTDRTDLYSSSQYALYLDELQIYEKIINNNEPDGSSIFMIRDSYFSPVIAFMMPMCREIHAIWSLEESDQLDIETYIKENDFDYIIIEVYPYNIGDAAFNYFKEGAE